MEDNKYIDEEISFFDLFKILFNRKWTLLGLIFTLTILSILVSLFLPKTYRSEGFLVLSDQKNKMEISEYKKYANLLLDKELFFRYLKEQKRFPKEKIEKIILKLNKKKVLNKLISPVFSNPESELNNYIIGANIQFECNDPETTQTVANIAGAYFKSLIILDKLVKYIEDNLSLAKIQIKVIENKLTNYIFDMEQLEEKKKRLIEIRKNYPEVQSLYGRQILSVEKGGERFLSPKMQLIGVESSISSLKNLIEIEKKANEIEDNKLKFFTNVNTNLIKSKSGDIVLKNLTDLLIKVFSEKDLKNDNAKIARNSIIISLENFSSYFYNSLKFAPEPNLPVNKIKPNRALIVTVSFIMSIFFSLLFVLFKEWWKNNKTNIMKK